MITINAQEFALMLLAYGGTCAIAGYLAKWMVDSAREARNFSNSRLHW